MVEGRLLRDAYKVDLTDGGETILHSHAGGAGPEAGTLVLKSNDESQGSFTASGVAKSYSLGANTWAQVMVEAEGYVVSAANAQASWEIQIRFGGTVKAKVQVRHDATGTGDVHTGSWAVKFSAVQQSGLTVDLYVSLLAGSGTCYVNSLRIIKVT